MSKIDLSNTIKVFKTGVKKHSPEIMTGIGIAGMVTSTVLAVKSTPKALILIEEEKRRQNYKIINDAKENGDAQAVHIDRLRPVEVIKTTWKCYIPAAITGTVSILCLMGASSVSARRNAALATAYTLTESAMKDYREKVIETIGEKKERLVTDAVAKDKVENNPVTSSEVIITEKGDTLCYDALSGRYFKSDIDKIKRAVNEANRQLLLDSNISLNELYDWVGLEHTKIGDDLGWKLDDGMIEPIFSSQLATDGTPCVVFDFDKTPQFNFDRWM